MTFNFTCYVCLDQMNPNNMIAISCGHVLCGSCYDTMYIRRGEERVCGLCRHRFGSGLKLFLDEGTTKTSEITYQGTSTNDYLNLEKIKKLEKDLETEKCITESLEFELKEKQLEIIEQKTIALALQREIEDNHEKINRLSKKISEIEIKPTPKKVVNDPDYLWLSNDPDEDRIKIHYKQEHDNKKNDLKISNNKYNNEKKRFNEVKNTEKNSYDNIRYLKELLNEKERKLESVMKDKSNLQQVIEDLKKENKILHSNNDVLEKELIRKGKTTRFF